MATGRDLDFFVSGRPMQPALIVLLYTVLADVVGALIVGQHIAATAFVELGKVVEVMCADAADVANHVGRERPERVLPKQPRLDLDARKSIVLRGETRHLLVR